MEQRPSWETRLIHFGLTFISVLSFGAWFIHEAWRILSPFFGQ